MKSLEVCDQPECLLRDMDIDDQALAKLIVRIISGDDIADVVDGRAPIEARERCTECAARVMRGGRPFPSVEEVERMLETGHWSHRRARRRERHESHDS